MGGRADHGAWLGAMQAAGTTGGALPPPPLVAYSSLWPPRKATLYVRLPSTPCPRCRRYNHDTGNLTAVDLMPSPRWYATPVTLHDGRVVVRRWLGLGREVGLGLGAGGGGGVRRGTCAGTTAVPVAAQVSHRALLQHASRGPPRAPPPTHPPTHPPTPHPQTVPGADRPACLLALAPVLHS